MKLGSVSAQISTLGAGDLGRRRIFDHRATGGSLAALQHLPSTWIEEPVTTRYAAVSVRKTHRPPCSA
jgi:hypothetical protein